MTLRKAVLSVSIVFVLLLTGVFAFNNPEPIAVDIGLARFESVSITLAFVVCFALGWLFGLLSAGLALLRMMNERRRLRQDLRFAEAELSSLRSEPLHDAD